MSRGDNLRALRDHLGETGDQFAERVGLTRQWISAIECGRRDLPGTLRTLERMATGLGLSVELMLAYLDGKASLRSVMREVGR